MARMTVREIEALKPTEWKTADTGLQIRVAKNGVKTWIVQYVVDGVQREYRLPKPWGHSSDDGHLSLKDARYEAEKIRALARQGIDYRTQLDEAKKAEEKRLVAEQAEVEARRVREATENLTVADLFDVWIADGVRRKDGNAELRRLFEKDVLPDLGGVAIKNVTDHELRVVLRKMVARGVNRLAVVACSSLTQMFRWAEKRQPWRRLLAEGNPVDLVDIETIVSSSYDINNQRDRVLSDDEIRELSEIFTAMRLEFDKADNKRSAVRPVARTTELSLWIMLSTLCRVGELSKSRWEHVDLNNAEWFIPATNTKGRMGKQNSLVVYLSPFALDQFRQLRELTGESEWCFPAKHKDGHICEKSISKQVGDRQISLKRDENGEVRVPMKRRSKALNAMVLSGGRNGTWTPHDLRRTGATIMQSLGVPLDVIDRCQNHVLSGSKTRRHYLHHEYATEKRDAWRLLGERLTLLTDNPKKVCLLKKVA